MTGRFVIAAGLLALVACGDNGITDPDPEFIQLSAQQAAVIATRAEQISEVHQDLEWLADSIEVVVRAGVQAKRLGVTSSGEDLVFYAVSLQRNVVTSTSSFATWHLIAFNDPSNPTLFILANGFAPGSGTTPPTSVNSGFGGEGTFAHLVSISGSSITDWRASAGGATFSTKSVGGACPVVGTPPAGVTCNLAEMDVSFDIVAFTPVPEDNVTLNLLPTTVPGVMLTIEQ